MMNMFQLQLLNQDTGNETFSGYLENISYENIRKEAKFPERKIAMLPF